MLLLAAIAVRALWLLRRHGARPLNIYFAASYVTGLVVVAVLQAS